MSTKSKKFAEQRSTSSKEKSSVPVKGYIPTGCTLLNLACSGSEQGGYMTGKIVHVIGDSSSGKSLLGLTTLAEAAMNPKLKQYKLELDDVERSNEFNVEQMFGTLSKRLVERNSTTIEDFYDATWTRIQAGIPFVKILDSMDALNGSVELDKFEEDLKARAAGKDVKGSYGMAKAKSNSDGLRKIKSGLKDTESLLMIISQTRDNIGISFAPKTHNGGRALKFYACYQYWLAVKQTLTRTIREVKHEIGIVARVKISKNHATGCHMQFDLPIYYGYGVDDVRANILWLCEIKAWKMGEKGALKTGGEFGEGQWTVNTLASHVEKENLQLHLAKITGNAWRELDAQLRRPGRYSQTSGNTESDTDEVGFEE